MALDRLTKVTGPGVSTDTNWVGNNANFTGITTAGSSFNIGVTTIHSTLAEVHNIKSTGILTATGGSFSGNVTAVDGTFTGNVSIAGTLTYEDVTNIDSVGIITAPAVDVDDFLDVGSNIKLGNAGVITATSFVGDGSGLIGVASTDNIVTGTAATFNTYPVDINAGLTIAGVTTTTDDIIIGADNKKLKLGAGGELELYQEGNHSSIKHNGGHYLRLLSNSFIIQNAAASKTIFVGDPNGESSLYFNGSKKLNTLNGGVDITGNLQVDGLHCLGQINLDSDIDVDGHTNLDNVSIAGVTTFASAINGSGQFVWDAADADVIIRDSTDSPQNFIYRDHSASKLYLGTTSNVVELRSNLLTNADSTYDIGTNSVRWRNVYADTLYGDGSNLTGITGTTISGNGDNKLITGSGTANTLIAEADLTFDGTNLKLTDHKNMYFGTGNDLRIWHDANNSYSQIAGGQKNLYIDGLTTYMRSGDGGGSGVENAIVMNNNGSVDLYHSGTKKLETTSSGVTVTGTVAATSYTGDGSNLTGITGTTINNNANNRLITGSGTANTLEGEAGLTYNGQAFQVNSVTSENNAFRIYNTTDNSVRYQINGEGNSFIGHTYPRADASIDLGFHTGYRWRDVVISGGIRFGSSSADDYLDDYEEGTFTPTINVGSYTTFLTNRYIKIGRLVHLHGGLIFNNNSSGTRVEISNIPFAQQSGGQYVGNVWLRRTSTGERNWNMILGEAGTNVLGIFRDSNGGHSDMGGHLSYSDFGSSATYFNYSITYISAS